MFAGILPLCRFIQGQDNFDVRVSSQVLDNTGADGAVESQIRFDVHGLRLGQLGRLVRFHNSIIKTLPALSRNTL